MQTDLRGSQHASDPHGAQPVLSAGPALQKAAAAIVFLHGRGSSAESILSLYDDLQAPDCAAFAPQAAGNTWYPHSFMAPLNTNQPFLDSALGRVKTLVGDLMAGGMAAERIVILGFSQGACLTLEFAVRNARRYGAIIAFTGGLIGPPGTQWNYPGSFSGTPALLATNDPDPHVPFERVKESAERLSAMHAAVDFRRYPGMPHTINQDEIDAARQLIRHVATTK